MIVILHFVYYAKSSHCCCPRGAPKAWPGDTPCVKFSLPVIFKRSFGHGHVVDEVVLELKCFSRFVVLLLFNFTTRPRIEHLPIVCSYCGASSRNCESRGATVSLRGPLDAGRSLCAQISRTFTLAAESIPSSDKASSTLYVLDLRVASCQTPRRQSNGAGFETHSEHRWGTRRQRRGSGGARARTGGY